MWHLQVLRGAQLLPGKITANSVSRPGPVTQHRVCKTLWRASEQVLDGATASIKGCYKRHRSGLVNRMVHGRDFRCKCFVEIFIIKERPNDTRSPPPLQLLNHCVDWSWQVQRGRECGIKPDRQFVFSICHQINVDFATCSSSPGIMEA